jgi:type VI secretion system secreted protein VgrG
VEEDDVAYTQENRRIAINTKLGEDVLLLTSFSGAEGISRPFHFEVEMISEQEDLSFDGIVGENATVRITLADGSDRYFNGYVSHFSQGGRDQSFVYYHAELVPWVWFLTQTSDCRIFQDKTVPDIIEQIFGEYGLKDYKLNVYGNPAKRVYCVQYRETDFQFITRLMEEEGIFYFFQHENGKHTMVLANSPSAHEECPNQATVRYELTAGGWQDDDVITEMRVRHAFEPAKYSQVDYNFETPSTSLLVGVGGGSPYELYDYRQGEYRTRGDGDTLARLRLQETLAPQVTVHGVSDCRAFTTGYKFTLKEHYRDDLNQAYVLTSLWHNARQGGSYRSGEDLEYIYENRFECLPYSTPYRPPRVTPHPLIYGSQTAVVVGPAGEEIYTDKYGRVKVQFHWDREGKKDENSSCWVRVSQNWAGKKWGAMFIPRIGQEVIVDFLEGNPDEPIITGRVYNAEQMPPYSLPGEMTKSTIKSNSSKGGGGFNELRFEDKKGSEQIFIHAQKNMDIRVEEDCYETVSKEKHLVVEQAQYIHVKDKQHETVDSDVMVKIGSDHHLKVTGKQAIEIGGSQSLKVTGAVAEQFGMSHSEQVSMGYYLKAMNVVIEADMGVTLKCGGNYITVDPVGVTIHGTLVVVDGTMTLINSGPGSPALPGSAGSLVSPAAPSAAQDADKADPGEMAQLKADQIQQQKGKYGAVKLKPLSASSASSSSSSGAEAPPDQEQKKHFIEIKLEDVEGKPVPGEAYKITLPDGATVAEGTLDEKGFARVDGIDPGSCKVTFPNLDKSVWKPK